MVRQACMGYFERIKEVEMRAKRERGTALSCIAVCMLYKWIRLVLCTVELTLKGIYKL